MLGGILRTGYMGIYRLLYNVCLQGEVLEDASIHRSTVVECMQWHQEKKIMSIGWRSGEVTTYNDQDHEFFEQSSIHRSPIRVLRWNQSGTQLISGDKVGQKC